MLRADEGEDQVRGSNGEVVQLCCCVAAEQQVVVRQTQACVCNADAKVPWSLHAAVLQYAAAQYSSMIVTLRLLAGLQHYM